MTGLRWISGCAAAALFAACGSSGGAGAFDAVPGGDGKVSTNPDGTVAGGPDADVSSLDKFSFFVTSVAAIRELSGNQNGFGGDLRFGETGQGAGLRGADKICTTIAEKSMPGSGVKVWHAFLSASKGEDGNQVNAIDRIGAGPWYDRLGRELAPNIAALQATRPTGGDATIKNDFPNEDGVLNHDPDGTGAVDNHDMLTGTGTDGKLYAATATCLDWTANAGNKTLEGRPHVGHSWPRNTGGGGGGGGGGGMDDWRSSLDESGCAPGINLVETGGPSSSANTVGNGGGYGGFYCFALTP